MGLAITGSVRKEPLNRLISEAYGFCVKGLLYTGVKMKDRGIAFSGLLAYMCDATKHISSWAKLEKYIKILSRM